MRYVAPLLLSTLAIFSACTSSLATANTIAQLQAAGALEVRSLVTTKGAIVPGQNVKLVLETATNSWFNGGTRISIPEVSGLVILQNEQFAGNASETRQGETWVIQRWTLDIFPQRPGSFTIGPIDMHVSVNAKGAEEEEEEEQTIEGILQAPATGLEVILPPTLRNIPAWISTPKLSVRQTFDKPLDSLQVGDAFEQFIEFEASDAMAMMLPVYEPEKISGLAAYPLPPVLENSINRGQTRARRSLRISYVVEQPGIFTLAPRDYYWWDTVAGELRVLTVPATSVIAGGTRAEVGKVEQDKVIEPGAALRYLIIVLGILLVCTLALKNSWRTHCARSIAYLRSAIALLKKPALPSKLNPENSAE